MGAAKGGGDLFEKERELLFIGNIRYDATIYL